MFLICSSSGCVLAFTAIDTVGLELNIALMTEFTNINVAHNCTANVVCRQGRPVRALGDA